jgi:hypothetical protein
MNPRSSVREVSNCTLLRLRGQCDRLLCGNVRYELNPPHPKRSLNELRANTFAAVATVESRSETFPELHENITVIPC